MSDIAQLPRPGAEADLAAPSGSRFSQTARSALHVAVPVIPTASPIWTDSIAAAAVSIPPRLSRTYVVANPPSLTASPPRREQRAAGALAPRPRKPYTTTKVREMWSASEHERMLKGLRLYKRDWAKVTSYVGTRSAAQVRSHAQKYFDRVARDKTDEYVPRARPKRRSSTPYPRKVRDDSPKTRPPQQIYHAPDPPTFAVPVVHPQTSPYDMQHVAYASPPLHHPVRMSPDQSSFLPQVSPSPYLQQHQHSTVNGLSTVPHRVFSPYLEICSAPGTNLHGADVHAPKEIHASPLSYASGQTYATHSPAIAQQAISVPSAPVYGVLSPITPGTFPLGLGRAPSITHTPVTVYGQPTMVRTQISQTVPRHSHPEGPVDSCSKCAALQRYGAVLQEIGGLRYVQGQPGSQAVSGKGASTVSPEVYMSPPATNVAMCASPRRDGPQVHTAAETDLGQAHPNSGTGSPRKRMIDASSLVCSDEVNVHYARPAPADNRAHRAKVMRSRNYKRGSPASKEWSRSRRATEDESESANFNREKHHHKLSEKGSLFFTLFPSSQAARGVSKKTKIAQQLELEMDKPKVGKHDDGEKKRRKLLQPTGELKGRPGQVLQQCGCDENHSDDKYLKTAPESKGELTVPGRGPSHETAMTTRNSLSPKSDESESASNCPVVETFSSRERMEIFDAVHSLQILAKTASSPSPSSGSNRNRCSRGEEEKGIHRSSRN